MKSKHPQDINARSQRFWRYRKRLQERLEGSGTTKPIEITPELERAINTPVNELPVDRLVSGAFRRAGADGDVLAHLRLAKYRVRKLDAIRVKNAARTKTASNRHADRGLASLARVREEARKELQRSPNIKRTELAKFIGPRASLSYHRTMAILKSLKLP